MTDQKAKTSHLLKLIWLDHKIRPIIKGILKLKGLPRSVEDLGKLSETDLRIIDRMYDKVRHDSLISDLEM